MTLTMDRPGVLPVCDRGHVAVAVTRGTSLRRVCPECLGDAIAGLTRREATVNDYLLRLEADGQPPKLSAAEVQAAQGWLEAAAELHGDVSPASLRKVVRGASRAAGVPTTEVMKWTLCKLQARGLTALRAEAAELTAA